MESTARRIASIDTEKFEAVMREETEALSPMVFVRKYLPRPPPIFSNREPGLGHRASRAFMRKIAAEINSFHTFAILHQPQTAAEAFDTRADRKHARKTIREIQDWLDEVDRRLKGEGV